MTVSIERLACGSLTANRSVFEAGAADDPVTLPVPAWLIRHPDGVVLFDCGMHADLTAEGPLRDTISLFFGLGMTDDDLITHQLATRDLGPDDIDVVVLSHLHFDHVGGLVLLPDSRVIVQGDEWQAGLDDDVAAANTFRREEYDLGHDVTTVHGDHDLFGDGRVTCLPTPGHTPGHQSLRIRLDSTEVILCADCAYFAATLDGGPLPPHSHDPAAHAQSITRLRAEGAGGAVLVPGHDADALAGLAPVLR